MRRFNLKLCTFIFSVALLATSCQEDKLELIDSYTAINFFPKSIIALEGGGSIVATGYENVIRLNDNTTDDSSKVVWSTKIPRLRIEAIVADDKDFIVVGDQQVVDTLKKKLNADYLKCVKLSEDGDILWEIQDTMMTRVEQTSVIALGNGEFGVFGTVTSIATDTLSYLYPFVLKINNQGKVIWKKIFNEKRSNDIKVAKTSEGGMTIIFNSVKNNNSDGEFDFDKVDLYINFKKIDNNGNVVLTKEHNVKKICAEEITDDLALEISGLELATISSTNEGYTVILESKNLGSDNLLAMKFDQKGEVFWSKKLNWGNFIDIKELEQINDDLFVIITEIGGLGERNYSYFNLVGLNKDMEILWNYKSKTDWKNAGYAISKGFNDDIYVTIGNEYADGLVADLFLIDDDFSKGLEKDMNSNFPYNGSFLSNLTISHFKIK